MPPRRYRTASPPGHWARGPGPAPRGPRAAARGGALARGEATAPPEASLPATFGYLAIIAVAVMVLRWEQ